MSTRLSHQFSAICDQVFLGLLVLIGSATAIAGETFARTYTVPPGLHKAGKGDGVNFTDTAKAGDTIQVTFLPRPDMSSPHRAMRIRCN